MADGALTKPLDAPAPWRRLWLPLAIFAVLALVPLFGGGGYMLSLFTRAMIFGLAAMSLDLVLGYGALVSFGHAAFLGLGAYTVGIAMEHGLVEGLLTFPLAIFVGALFAFVTGAISLKTRGVYFIMITLAFGQMAFFTAQSLARYGGDDGIRMSGRSAIAGQRFLENDLTFFYVVLVLLVLVWWLLRRVVQSRFGRVLRGTRENERRMRALGFDPFRYRLAAYVLSGAVCALAGALLANRTQFVSPAVMSWQHSGELIVMVVLGGMGSLHGAVLGGVSVILLEEALSQLGSFGRTVLAPPLGAFAATLGPFLGIGAGVARTAVEGLVVTLTAHWKIVFGALIVLIALFARGGLVRLLERRRDS
jgi:branched-chain amino acid transport system permease protein